MRLWVHGTPNSCTCTAELNQPVRSTFVLPRLVHKLQKAGLADATWMTRSGKMCSNLEDYILRIYIYISMYIETYIYIYE